MLTEIKLQFLKSIKSKPSILFLGQNLNNTLEPYNFQKHIDNNTINLNTLEKVMSPFNALHNFYHLKNYPWNAVYTSNFAKNFSNIFENEWREIQVIRNTNFVPIYSKNKNKLNISMLFGENDFDSIGHPPGNLFDYLDYFENNTRELLSRMQNNISLTGNLIIEGYSTDDWIKSEHIYPIINKLLEGQSYFFSFKEDFLRDPYIKRLVQNKKILTIEESLEDILSYGVQQGIISSSEKTIDINSHRIIANSAVIEFSKTEWNNFSKSGRPLDELIFSTKKSSNKNALYMEFKEFLNVHPNTDAFWKGIIHGFSFERTFENEILKRINKLIKKQQLIDDPLIIHGQAGSGKTLMLGNIAKKIYKDLNCPVLFIEKKAIRPDFDDIFRFCDFVEKNGAPVAVIIWDGMYNNSETYYELSRWLSSKGKRVIVLGTNYTNLAANGDSNRFNLNVNLDDFEIQNLYSILKMFYDDFSEEYFNKEFKSSKNILVSLYTILPETRSKFVQGIKEEASFVNERIRQLKIEIDSDTASKATNSKFQLQLLSAMKELELDFTEELTEDTFVKNSDIEKILQLTMFTGQFGLQIPLELLMRILNYMDYQTILKIIKEIDLIRIDDDYLSNSTLGPRHRFEAQLFLKSFPLDSNTVLEIIESLLVNAKDTNDSSDNLEISFITDLLIRIGPNSQYREEYKDIFKSISDILEQLREAFKITNHKILLQECTYRREWVKDSKNTSATDPNEYIDELTKSEVLIENALANNNISPNFKSYLISEQAATISLLLSFKINDCSIYELKRIFFKLKESMYHAKKLNTSNYHSVDSLFRTVFIIADKYKDNSDSLVWIKNEMNGVIDQINPEDFDTEMQNQFFENQFKYATRFKDVTLTKESLEELKKASPAAYYYLISKEMLDNKAVFELNLNDDFEAINSSYKVLERNFQYLTNDSKSLYLYLQLWWITKNQQQLFRNSRQVPKFSHEDWERCEYLLDLLLSTESIPNEINLKLLRAFAYFNLGNERLMNDEFSSIKDIDYRSKHRTSKLFIAGDRLGNINKYNATVDYLDENNSLKRGYLIISGLKSKVAFFPRDFGSIRKGETINCQLTFNLIGILAEPWNKPTPTPGEGIY